jgi:hypothetical protein
MSRNYKVIAYDFDRSFSPENKAERITNSKGKVRLNYEIWKAGTEAAHYLQNEVMPILNPKPINLEQLQLAIPELCDMLQDDLQEQWLKIIENMIDDGSIDFQPKPLTKDQFLAAWKERGFVERSQFIAQLAPLFMSMGSKDINTMTQLLPLTLTTQKKSALAVSKFQNSSGC